MQPKALIRCRRLRGKADTIMIGSEVKVAVCNGIEKANELFQKNLKSVLEMYEFSVVLDSYDNMEVFFERAQEYEIIIYLLKASVEEELKAVDKMRKQDKNSKIILVAGNGAYLKEAYKVQPFRYLFLSDSVEEIREALDSAINGNRERKGLALEGEGKYYYILLRDVMYIEALGDEIGIFTIDGVEYVLRMPLKHIFFLIENDFIRFNRQQIVNARYIDHIDEKCAMLVNNVNIVISGRERKNVAEKYAEYIWKMKLE